MKINNNILLVSANQHPVPYPVYPIGLSYLLMYLKNKLPGLNIKIFDFNLGDMAEFEIILAEFNPSVVGVSFRNIDDTNSLLQNQFVTKYKYITDKIKTHSGSIIVIVGLGFSIFPKLIYEKILPHYGIYGDGEGSFHILLIALKNGTSTEKIDGLVFSKDNQIIINQRKNNLKNLGVYLEENIVDYYWGKSGMVGIQTKRGCPYDCIYCTYPIIEKKNVRVLDPDKVVLALSKIYHQKVIDYIFFTDSVFNINNNDNIELVKKIIASGIKIKWGAYFSLNNLDTEILSIYKKSGLTHIEFGTESFSDIQLKNYHKKNFVDDVIKVSEIAGKRFKNREKMGFPG